MAKVKRRSRPRGATGDTVTLLRDVTAVRSARYAGSSDAPLSITLPKKSQGIMVGKAPGASWLREVKVPHEGTMLYVELSPEDFEVTRNTTRSTT